MTRMSEEDLEHRITNQQLGLNPLFAQCPWGWMKDGIKFNLICRISLEELMEQTILKLWGTIMNFN